MANIDYVRGKVALAGDPAHVMYRGRDRPLSWPEVRVLQFLHGEANVFDCEFDHSEQSNGQTEKMRLLGIYGAEPVNMVYPGLRPQMELDFPGDKDPAGQIRPVRQPALYREAAPVQPAPKPEDPFGTELAAAKDEKVSDAWLGSQTPPRARK